MDRVLLFAKKTNWSDQVAGFLKKHYGENLTIFQGNTSDNFPEKALGWSGEIIISYLSPWIIPKKLLVNAKKFAINFHPGSLSYPGAGCYNFAIYEDSNNYGVTCHHMVEQVDRGNIIAIKTFPIARDESVQSLKEKSMRYLWELFGDVMEYVVHARPLPNPNLCWKRKPFMRKQLNDLCKISFDMSSVEIIRRIRATYFPGALGPYVNLEGYKFEFNGQRI